jgi:predicted DNA-binding transcriptional regulator YafY
MLQSLSLSNALKESKDMHSRILCEEVPSSQKWLTPIITAMKDECIIEMTYQSFNRDEPNTFEAEPYCVKMSQGRWYVLARSVYYSEPRIYALDRILDLRQTTEKFELPRKFDAEEYFSGSYGTYTAGNPETVEIKVDSYQAKYLRSLPIHHSQEEIEATPEHSVFRFRIRPTYDFERALLSYGATLEVLKPLSLREKIIEEICDMKNHYTNDNS